MPDLPPRSLDRRGFLSLAAGGLVAAVTGCTSGTSSSPSPSPLVSAPPVPSAAPAEGGRWQALAPRDAVFVQAVSDDGRALVDRAGTAVLGLGDTVWTMPAVYDAAALRTYFARRREQGFTSVQIALWPFHFRDGEQVDGCVDGVQAFADGDITRWDERYWRRVDAVFTEAVRHGFTVWAGVLTSGLPYSIDTTSAQVFGALVGARYRDVPGLVWIVGVDYPREEWGAWDDVFLACVRGLREAGDRHLVTVQYANDDSLTADNPRWRDAQVQAAYTYRAAYRVIADGWARDLGPVVLIESAFEDENNEGGPETTAATIRRQALWTYTCGGVHVSYGRHAVWRSEGDFLAALDSTAALELGRIRQRLSALDWRRLLPDTGRQVLVDGTGLDVTRGTQAGGHPDPLESELATCAASPDRDLVVVHLPSARRVVVDLGDVEPSAVRVVWWDPTTGLEHEGPWDPAGLQPPAGAHADGGTDWLLVVQREVA